MIDRPRSYSGTPLNATDEELAVIAGILNAAYHDEADVGNDELRARIIRATPGPGDAPGGGA